MSRYTFLVFFISISALLISCGQQAESTNTQNNSVASSQEVIEVTREVTRVVEIEVVVTNEVTRVVEVTREVLVTPESSPTPAPTATPEVKASAANYLVANFDLSTMPVGEEDNVSIILTGEIDRFGNMPFIIQNNTGGPIVDLSVSSTVRSQEGNLLGTGDADLLFPDYIVPGGYGIGEMRFVDGITDDAAFEYQLQWETPSRSRIQFGMDLEVIEHELAGGVIVGFVLNSNNDEANLIGVRYLCLSEDLSIIGMNYSSLAQDAIPSGEQGAFSAQFRTSCPLYILTSSGL